MVARTFARGRVSSFRLGTLSARRRERTSPTSDRQTLEPEGCLDDLHKIGAVRETNIARVSERIGAGSRDAVVVGRLFRLNEHCQSTLGRAADPRRAS